MKKRILSCILAAGMLLGMTACGQSTAESASSSASQTPSAQPSAQMATSSPMKAVSAAEESASEASSVDDSADQLQKLTDAVSGYTVDFDALTFDNSAWQYDSDNDVYYQYGVGYCAAPAAVDYETMGVYVPGAYLTGTANGDGTYTCTVNDTAKVGNYTAESAPIVMPVNTAGYSAQASPTGYDYNSVSSYLTAGFVYVYSGCRGRNNGYNDDGSLAYSGGAPWGATDLKAAVRYLRLNTDLIPGDSERIFTFGHSGGGAQSAVVGSSGDSELYFDYLASIGAAMYDQDGSYISDAVYGAMCWCPITSLDYADEAYEWNMGQYMDSGTRADGTWTRAMSADLADAYGSYLSDLGLVDADGNALTLTRTDDGSYTAGSYYDYMLAEIQQSLNNFLSDTEFPYTPSNSFMADGGFGGGGMPGMSGTSSSSTTYETVEDYIASLNTDGQWVTYDSASNTATITSIEDFAKYVKNATKDVGAFDSLTRGQAENYVFGDDTSDALHFDATMAKLLEDNQEKYAAYSDWDASYVYAYQEYKTSVDSMGSDSQTRQNMYNPMYYLTDYYAGSGTSTVAPHWRIRTGITQGDTALTVETNLALALGADKAVSDVDFETVWAQGHTMAERTGDSTTNFIAWVEDCM